MHGYLFVQAIYLGIQLINVTTCILQICLSIFKQDDVAHALTYLFHLKTS